MLTALLVVLLLVVSSSGTAITVAPFVLAQPLPCQYFDNRTNTLTVNGTVLLESQNGTACRYPYPEDIGVPMECVQRHGVFGWIAADPLVDDIFVPNDVLLDFCISNFFSRRNILIPHSSNMSVWRDLDGSPRINGTAGGLVIAEGTVYNYGWTLITINSAPTVSAPEGWDPNVTTPVDPTTFGELYTAQAFDMSNLTEYWQFQEPGIKCQTLGLTFEVVNVTDSATGFLPPADLVQYQILTTVFDQCQNDLKYFVGVVGGVGGAIIAATVIAAFVALVLGIKESRKAHEEALANYEQM